MKLLRFLYPWRYWLLAWLMGVGLMYLVSWPARLYRLADDEMFEASSHDGTYLATRQLRQDDPSVGIGATRERDAKLLIRKASSGWLYRTIESDSVRISSVEFANHDSHVVAQCDDRVVAWNVSTGQQTMPATPGHLHSVTRAPADAQWAVILLSDDLSAAEWKLRYNGVAFVDIASGETISTLQPFNLHKGPWSVPGLAIAPDGQRAVTISLAPQVQEDEESPLQYTVWDTRSGTIIGKFEDSNETDPYSRNERMYPRSWTLSSDSKQLWLLFAEYSELSNKGIAYLHAWNLETLRLEKRLVEETRGDVLIALGMPTRHRFSAIACSWWKRPLPSSCWRSPMSRYPASPSTA
ncbi:hypothetical protein NG895_03440 [Aeoliella sp. ICT_H6.2]|uniref:WD40 repeat protein n=1 Tax=Aeoliella straminimaris TaxID=2954799 RepID=A0A9X2F7A0_9BACT|nr:hypothetical protein [Aeoliella straminimaris]MCO6042953.1 hypothetical protein [Aeoliella straminimaris]